MLCLFLRFGGVCFAKFARNDKTFDIRISAGFASRNTLAMTKPRTQ
jgi:hypothetical protein